MLNITKVQLSTDGWTLNILSPRVATITNPLGQRKVSYFGFDAQEKALQFQQWLIDNTKCSAATVRKAERLSMNFECKAWGVPTELIVELAQRSTINTNTNNNSYILLTQQ